MTRVARSTFAVVVALSCSSSVFAQDSKSAPLARQLAAALDAGSLDSIAAQDPSAPNAFVAALYFKGLQILVVSGRYSVPQLLTERIAKKEYRDVYLDVNGASAPDSKIFIEDPGIDGLKAKREENQPFDSVEIGGKRTLFNNDWKGQKLSEQEYMKAFAAADDRYAQLLTALLSQLKPKS